MADQQDDDLRKLLRGLFEVCEDTESIEPKNDFERGRVFEAKRIRRGIGTWFQDEFCGRTHMGEPIARAALFEADAFGWRQREALRLAGAAGLVPDEAIAGVKGEGNG